MGGFYRGVFTGEPDPPPAEGDAVPAFIRDNVSNVREVPTAPPPANQEYPGTETIAQATPGRIAIYHPEKYDKSTRTHEMTHEFQESRATGAVPLPKGYALAPFGEAKPYAPEQYAAGDPRNYSYGGQAGLEAARRAGKTMADFNAEQQADIVADYQKAQDAYLAKVKAGKATSADLRALYQLQQTYHPFLQQLANVPGRTRDMLPSVRTLLGVGQPAPLAPAPGAPGLPSYDVAGMGMVTADPLLGGKSVPIPKRKK